MLDAGASNNAVVHSRGCHFQGINRLTEPLQKGKASLCPYMVLINWFPGLSKKILLKQCSLSQHGEIQSGHSMEELQE